MEEGGTERARAPTNANRCAHTRAPARSGFWAVDRRIFGADSPTHSLASATHCTVPSFFPSARACVPHNTITGSLPIVLVSSNGSPLAKPGLYSLHRVYLLYFMGRQKPPHRPKYRRRRHFLYINIKGGGQEDKFFSRLGSGRRISGD